MACIHGNLEYIGEQETVGGDPLHLYNCGFCGSTIAKKASSKMIPKKIFALGMELDEWKHAGCIAHFGVGNDWATLYDIISGDRGKGHATELLLEAKSYYEKQGKRVGGTIALNPIMKKLYEKIGIKEYT